MLDGAVAQHRSRSGYRAADEEEVPGYGIRLHGHSDALSQ